MSEYINMDRIMSARLGETEDTDTLRVKFKKTINIRQYETETIEAESTLIVPNNIVGIERMLMLGILQAQLEYEVYYGLALKEQITQTEFMSRKVDLEKAVTALKEKAETITGKSMLKII